MKKTLSLMAGMFALLGVTPAVADTNFGPRSGSVADLTGGPAVRTRANVDYEKYETRSTTRTYNSNDNVSNLYYAQPTTRSEMYTQYSSSNPSQNVRVSRSEILRSELQRKYFLSHPFFQPLKGKFGSVTDLSYGMNSYDMALTLKTGGIITSDNNASWGSDVFSVKEDFSYGITDRLAVLGMLKFDYSKYKLDWATAPDDEMTDSKLSVFGAGLQWRFADTTDWIATLSGYYQRQDDISNNFVLDLKGGYKISKTTLYALGRLWYMDFDGNSYGNVIEGKNETGEPASFFIAYNTDIDTALFIEGGLGVFSVLDKDWTLNAELVLGHYDWHQQASIKAAIGWQPNDWFALNIYAKTSLYDSADGKELSYWWNEPGAGTEGWVYGGGATLDGFSETTLGLQAIFMF